jgi:ATP-binding cassette, subfamily B, bacterial
LLDQTRLGQAVLVLRMYQRALLMPWRAHKGLALLSWVLILINAFMTPLQLWITALVIDGITAAAGGTAIDSAAGQNLLLTLALFILVWVVGQIAGELDLEVRELLGEQVEDYNRRLVFGKATTLDLAFFESPSFFDLFTVAKSEMYRVRNVAYQATVLIQNTITAVSLFVLLAGVNLWIPIILLVTTLPRLFGMIHFNRRKAELYMKNVPEQRMTNYLAWLMGERAPVKEIRLFGTHNYLIERMHRAHQKYFSNLLKVVLSQEKWLLLFTVFMAMGIASIWVYTGMQALAGLISLGSVAFIFQAVERSRDNLLAFGYTGGFFAENTVYLQTLFKFLDLPPNAVAGALVRSPEAVGAAADLGGPIRFDHVSFRYPGSDEAVLSDVSFTIEPGETVALVGENGAGKTTLVKLLTRLYDPTEGAISIAGRDLRLVDPERYYQQIGVIFQDFYRYDLTVKENIGFGNLAELENMARIRQAAQMAGAAELIRQLPHQYETMLGRVFYEDAKDLSGGEWQKVALARAFMRDVPLLILDEPTAALDAFAENAVYSRFAELTKGRTTIFVTHRLSSVRMAQKILVLKAGRLIQVGTHDALLAAGGEYASMFKLQAERYQSTSTTETGN